ncbi:MULTISPECIES: hypothetical protein [unclassified Pseudomonas]|uniref:hypothetical protein n=1 Tax=unclassified Pseudomonas TaxID=196821 RepID=UPI00209855EE|nr:MULTISPECIES: hypothetical protein [unclassified Pseudomonas]MCO7519298.1 hypothetical protein [Pseudomonas sp. 1]MCO7541719.1 hypothetical protein [Pseudomonas sp. VA159-2]
MRNRGKVYWDWADPQLHFRNCDERLSCGTLINVQVRTSPLGATQLFFGIYKEKGEMLLEESYDDCKGQTMSAAMAWAQERARAWVATTCPAILVPARQSLPRKGARLAK